MSQSTHQTSQGRNRFLQLRSAADLPAGGEIVLRSEVDMIAEKLDISTTGKNKDQVIFEIVQTAKRIVYGYSKSRDWETAKESARDYQYLQSQEAELIAEAIRNQNPDTETP